MKIHILATLVAAGFFGIAPVTHAADSLEQLVKEYKLAMSKKDLNALMSLVAFSAETEKHRPRIMEKFRSQFGKKILSTQVVPFETFKAQYDEAVKKGTKSVLEPKAWLMVELAKEDLGGGVKMKVTDVTLVGTKGMSYYLDLQ